MVASVPLSVPRGESEVLVIEALPESPAALLMRPCATLRSQMAQSRMSLGGIVPTLGRTCRSFVPSVNTSARASEAENTLQTTWIGDHKGHTICTGNVKTDDVA
ncbi:hypothetical protein PMIN04_005834 [Paraphaeosphaeria minitans]|uniref:Uncharacterized protein n=1 Tax=Paraphaeosphaeria minitans TaxID=565426 RepID=A0A9P6KSY4_9PLEO|nr:hypothetical protein PMIN01_05561 [Paraphaeosphaeria minitans]